MSDGGDDWSTAFAAAARVRPIGLGKDEDGETDFVPSSWSSRNDVSGIASVSRAACSETTTTTTTQAVHDRDGGKREREHKEAEKEDEEDDDHGEGVAPKKKRRKKKNKKNKKNKNDRREVAATASAEGRPDKVPATSKDGEEHCHRSEAVVDDPAATAAAAPSFPYPVDSDDHCETPFVAYEHVSPLLRSLAAATTTKRSSSSPFVIYDPYYCDGGTATKLARLGHRHVRHAREDCYAAWEDPSAATSFDVLLTNPPYSGDHLERLTAFLGRRCATRKGWFLLMPAWVHKRACWTDLLRRTGAEPFYLVPRRRYVYEPPPRFRTKRASDTHKKSSPFPSMWYVWGGDVETTRALFEECRRRSSAAHEFDVARSKSALRDLRRRKR